MAIAAIVRVSGVGSPRGRDCFIVRLLWGGQRPLVGSCPISKAITPGNAV
jgi:hypothetical protein